jgi:predicted transcriptional regulator
VQTFAAFLRHGAQVVRLQIVLSLLEGEMSIGALRDELAQSEQKIKRHLKLLALGKMVVGHRQRHEAFYGLTATGEALARLALRIAG